MENVYVPVNFAPGNLNQPILPNWSFNLLNVNLGASSNAKFEHAVLQNVGSYGKQIGHLAEALEVVIRKLQQHEGIHLSQKEKDCFAVVLGEVAAVRQLKEDLG